MFREQTIDVSADLVRACPGFAMDIGGSATKIVYRSKQDWEDVDKNKDAKTGKLRLLSCARTELDAALAKVKEDVYITPGKDGKPTEIFTCGLGCHQFARRINRALNVKLANVMELDCFIKGFTYLVNRYDFNTLILPPCQDVVDKFEVQMERMRAKFDKFKEFTTMEFATSENTGTKSTKVDRFASSAPVTEVLGDDMYPCVMAMLGSAFGVIQLKKDGTFAVPDGSHRGGRTLLGLGSLLCGANSYNEIIDLAEKGNLFNVTMSIKDFNRETIPTENEEDEEEEEDEDPGVYGTMLGEDDADTEDSPVFIFGKAVSKPLSDFAKEDLAAALVQMSVSDAVQVIHMTARDSGAKRVFVTGGFTSREYMRERFTYEWCLREAGSEIHGKPSMELHFMGQGAHLGALGALINNVEKFIGRDGTVQASNQPDDSINKNSSQKDSSQKDSSQNDSSQKDSSQKEQ